MSRGVGLLAVAVALAFAGALTWACGGGELDRRLPLRSGGELETEVVLGSGFSFDKGSLTITSSRSGEEVVRVVVDISGWGGYAVALDAREHEGTARVAVKVEGFLHWAFGGPTVDVTVQVPPGTRVDARIEGGPLLLEDLEGPIAARAEGGEVTLRRVEGDVRLEARGERLLVEDVDGSVHLESETGGIEVRGVRGPVAARSARGGIRVVSVTGPVTLAADKGGVQVERVRGDLRVVTRQGRIEVEDVEGSAELETVRGGIDVEELNGPIRARNERGGIEVEFVGPPAGRIESERGEILVEVPAQAGFRLEARTERGEVSLDRDLFLARLEPNTEPSPVSPSDDPGVRARALAREIQNKVLDSVRKQLDGDPDAWDWGWDRHGRARDGGAWGEWRPEGGGWSDGRTLWAEFQALRGEQLTGDVNGGGAPLQLRTGKGSIRIETH